MQARWGESKVGANVRKASASYSTVAYVFPAHDTRRQNKTKRVNTWERLIPGKFMQAIALATAIGSLLLTSMGLTYWFLKTRRNQHTAHTTHTTHTRERSTSDSYMQATPLAPISTSMALTYWL